MARKVKAERATPGARGRAKTAQPVHRYTFLQSLEAKGFEAQSDAEVLYRKLSGAHDLSGYNDFLADINEGLEFVEFEIRRIRSPVDDQWYVGFVNRASDSAAKLRKSHYTHEELAYFKSTVEAIAESDELADEDEAKPCLGSMAALNLVYEPPATQAPDEVSQSQAEPASQRGKPLGPRQKETTLAKLVTEGWLAHTQGRAAYSIGPRTFLELRQFLNSLELTDARKTAWSQVL